MKLVERMVHRLKVGIENIGVVIPETNGPISQVIKGKGRVLPHPKAVEEAFHQQMAQPCPPDGHQDYLTPLAEKRLGIVEFQPDDPRIKYLEETYKLDSGSIRPRILLDEEGEQVKVWDWVRPDEKIAGAPEFPPQAEWRVVEVPDIAGAMAAKGARQLID